MSEILVSVENVSKKFSRSLRQSLWYGVQDMVGEMFGCQSTRELRAEEFWAVRNVSFKLKRGECLGLIGSNGAGKTTLLRMLNGLIRPDCGRIEMRGRVGGLIALGAGFNPILTGRENIYVNASVLGLVKREIDEKFDEIVDFAEIGEFIDTPVQNYSSGMQVRLGFAVATALQPDILLLDEVLAVGDASFRTKCFNRIESLINSCAVIFVSHSMPQITRVSDKVILMKCGNSLMYGSNIGEIILRYHELTEVIAQSSSFEGGGQGKINSIIVENATGNTTTILNYGESWKLSASISLTDNERYSDVKLLITFADQEENNVAQIEKTIPTDQLFELFTIELSFGACLFNAGKYSVTASIQVGKRGALAHVVRRALELTVKREQAGYAPIIFENKTCFVVKQHSESDKFR